MAAKFRAPGFYRASWLMVAAVGFSALITWLVRMTTGHTTFTHFLSGDAILSVSLLAVPLAFLVGIGGFDYWFYWASGRKTRPEDHSGHGAVTWRPSRDLHCGEVVRIHSARHRDGGRS